MFAFIEVNVSNAHEQRGDSSAGGLIPESEYSKKCTTISLPSAPVAGVDE